jgi:hypothetical protein
MLRFTARRVGTVPLINHFEVIALRDEIRAQSRQLPGL